MPQTPPQTLTITIHVASDPADNRVSYDPPNKEVCRGGNVVFKVEGSTVVFDVTFPNGSPFTVPDFTVGGATLAAQSSSETVSSSTNVADYHFVATPSVSAPHCKEQPGTVSGDIDVVPDTGGGEDEDKGHPRR